MNANFFNQQSRFQARVLGLIPILILFTIWIPAPALANLRLWTGNSGSSANWSDPNNWNPVGVPQNGDDLAFPDGSARQSNFNDLVFGSFNTFTFSGSSSTYTLSGNAVTLANGINCELTGAQATISLVAVTLGQNQTFIGNGVLVLNSDVDLSGHNLTLEVETNSVLSIGGVVKGVGNIYKTGTGTGSFYGTSGNTYQGRLYVNTGAFSLGKTTGPAVTAGGMEIGMIDAFYSGSATGLVFLSQSNQIDNTASSTIADGVFDLNGWSEAIGPLIVYYGGVTNSLNNGSQLTLLGNVTRPITGYFYDQPVTISGRVNLVSDIRFSIDADFGLALNLFADVTGPGGMIFDDLGTVLVTGNNTFAGKLEVSYGTVAVNNHPQALGNSTNVIIDNGGTLHLVNTSFTNKTLTFEDSYATLQTFGAVTWNGPIIVQGVSNVLITAGNTNNAATLELAGPIHGTGGIVFGGDTIELTANNDFSGSIGSACKLLLLNSASGHPFAGPLSVGGDYDTLDLNPIVDDGGLGRNPIAEVRWSRDTQCFGLTVTTVDANGYINLNNHSDTFGSMGMAGGKVDTGSGVLSLVGGYVGSGAASSAVINGNLAPYPANHVFAITNGAASPDLIINAVISGNGGILKQGNGELSLTSPNTYTGITEVMGGLLIAGNDQALGTTANGTIVLTNATLEVDGLSSGSFAEPLQLEGTGWDGTSGALYCKQASIISSPITLLAAATIGSDDTNAQMLLNSTISGTGSTPLTKSGPGIVSLGGSSANTYSGDTTVSTGALWLAKTSFASAAPGNLVVGPGTANSPASVAAFGSAEIGGDTITVNGNSVFNLNNNNQNLTHLILNDGGSVQTGSGTLTFPAGGTVNVGSQSFLGSRVSASISGKLGLPNTAGAYVTFGVGSYNPLFASPAGPELDVLAAVSSFSSAFDYGLIKSGSGQMRFSGNNSFSGKVSVNGGTLIAASSTALGTASATGDTEINSNATLAVEGDVIILNEPLYLNSTATPTLDVRSGSNKWTGTITLTSSASINVASNSFLEVTNVVGGAGGLTKLGPGTLQFHGAVSNSYGGGTVVSAGVLEAGRTNVVSIPGDAVIGDDSTTNVTATLRSLRDQQLRPTANVNIHSSGLLDFLLATSSAPPNQRLRTMTGHGQVHVDFLSTLTISNDIPFDFYGPLNASLAQPFTKLGSAMMRAWGAWNWPNGLSINAGDFWFNGTAQNADVNSGARLRGDGHFTGGVSIEPGGFLGVDSMFPDHQGGDLDISDMELNAGGTVEIDLFGPSPTGGNDSFNVQSAFLRGASLNVNFNYPPRDGDVIKLINKTSTGAISGTFSNWPAGLKQLGTVPVLVNYAGGDGNDLTLTVTNLALAYVGYRLAEGNGNQTVEPNECNLLYVTLVNRRISPLTITNAFLRATTANGARVTITTATYPTIPAGSSVENLTAFQVSTDTNLPCGNAVSFELDVSVPGEGQFGIPFTLVAGNDCTHPTGPCQSCSVATGLFTSNAPITPQPLYFVGSPSICYPPKAYPGVNPATNLPPVGYLTHSFTNSTTNALCITAQLDNTCVNGVPMPIAAAAYLGAYIPALPWSGYLGDSGAPGLANPVFSFQVPAGSNFVVAVNALSTNLSCANYTLEVFGLPCSPPVLAVSSGPATRTVKVDWSTAYPGFSAQQKGKLGGTFTNVTQIPAIVNGRYTLTNIAATSNQFYRLKK